MTAPPRLAWRIEPAAAVLGRAPPAAGWLGEEEAERLAGLAGPQADTSRHRFLAARWLLRELLAGAGGPQVARQWVVSAAAGQPPRAARPGAGVAQPAPRVSLSHSGDWVAAAVADGPVGIDIEAWPPRRARDEDALLAAICHPDELPGWRQGAPGGPALRLLRCWTLKEAAVKALGGAAWPTRLRELRCALRDDDGPAVAWSACLAGWVGAICLSGAAASPGAGWQAADVRDLGRPP